MAGSLPVICVFGATSVELRSAAEGHAFETTDLDTRCYESDRELEQALARDRPVAIVTVGALQSFSRLHASAPEVRRRWIHYDSLEDLERIGRGAFHCFVDGCVRERKDLPPLVSVFTATYNTGGQIERPHASLRAQTYPNWEWVLVDDSDDDERTFKHLQALARADHRLGVFRHHEHRGSIGQVKRWACRLANGQILVELDHDDELSSNALADVVRAFGYFDGSSSDRPLAGFAYGDFAELDAAGRPIEYSSGWAFGYGSYRAEAYRGRRLAVANAPNVNAKTIRHIVGVPNHVRCWRSDCYQEIGGHSRHIHVADDYELLVRTFLATRMARVPKLTYLQFRNRSGNIERGNTHKSRNREIQRLTRAFSQHYDRAIHERLLSLGVDDFVWQDGQSSFSRLRSVPNPEAEPHCTLVVPL